MEGIDIVVSMIGINQVACHDPLLDLMLNTSRFLTSTMFFFFESGTAADLLMRKTRINKNQKISPLWITYITRLQEMLFVNFGNFLPRISLQSSNHQFDGMVVTLAPFLLWFPGNFHIEREIVIPATIRIHINCLASLLFYYSKNV